MSFRSLFLKLILTRLKDTEEMKKVFIKRTKARVERLLQMNAQTILRNLTAKVEVAPTEHHTFHLVTTQFNDMVSEFNNLI